MDETAIVKMHERIKTLENKNDRLEKKLDKQDKIIINMERIAISSERMQEDIKEVKSDVAMLKAKPSQKWDDFIKSFLAAAVGAIVAFAFAKIGM